MSYIGNARSLLIIGSNTRDDLVPQFEGQQTFELSQEVPGGYENSIAVLKQKYIIQNIIFNNTDVSIIDTDRTVLNEDGILVPRTEKRITATNPYLAITLAKFVSGDKVTIDLNDDTSSLHGTFDVLDVVYTGTSTSVYIASSSSQTVNDGSNTTEVTLSSGRYNDWTILEPEKDYTVGNSPTTNKSITFSQHVSLNDKLYVLHKGEATYNFTPTIKSVGPEQLQENLRNFRCDRHIADGSATFVLSGTDDVSYVVIDAKSLLVSVDGQLTDSDGSDSSGNSILGQWTLDAERDSNGFQTITFHDAPDTGASVRILHLGFSTVSRRAAFSPGQNVVSVLPNSVGDEQLKTDSVTESKISNGSVSTTKIRNNSVTGSKILLNNAESVRGKTSAGSEQNLLSIASDNSTIVSGKTEVSISIDGNKTASITSTAIEPQNTNISLGSNANKFKDGSFSGTVSSASVSVSGNILVDGTVDGVDVATLNTTVEKIKKGLNIGTFMPIGMMMMYPALTLPAGFLRCDGSAISRTTYAELFAILGTTFGSGDGSTTFNLPDLITRTPVGANGSGSDIGQNEGVSQSSRTVTHSHTGASHTHAFSHTHNVPGHYHAMDVSSGSTLAITSSGTHETVLSHTHSTPYRSNGTVNTTPGTTATAISASGHTGTDQNGLPVPARNKYTNPSEFPATSTGYLDWQDGEHRHSVNSNSNTAAHQHYFSSTHTHGNGFRKATVREKSSDPTLNAFINQVSSQPIADGNVDSQVGTASGYTGSSEIAGVSSTNHGHEVHVIRNTGTHYSSTNHHITITGGHSHFVTIPPFTGASSSSGTHTHNSSTFSGSIGKVTDGSNGNTDITTNSISSTTVPVPSDVGTTGLSVSPHLIVNFIIKATNTQVDTITL